jgi:hypothetical protein
VKSETPYTVGEDIIWSLENNLTISKKKKVLNIKLPLSLSNLTSRHILKRNEKYTSTQNLYMSVHSGMVYHGPKSGNIHVH